MTDTIDPAQITVVPANEATWDDLLTVFGKTDYAPRCLCQAFKTHGWHWAELGRDERVARLQAQTNCDDPDAETPGEAKRKENPFANLPKEVDYKV